MGKGANEHVIFLLLDSINYGKRGLVNILRQQKSVAHNGLKSPSTHKNDARPQHRMRPNVALFAISDPVLFVICLNLSGT